MPVIEGGRGPVTVNATVTYLSDHERRTGTTADTKKGRNLDGHGL